jgi:RimJ/RimL family protein N-acetyltransferase
MPKEGNCMNETITLRPATIDDADMLLEWRNDPETRKASHNTDHVQRDDHISWLSRTLGNPNRRLYVAEENGSPIGTVRADLADGVWELSWTVSPKARGRGVAKRMVAVLATKISEPIRAEVKTGNIASARIAEHAGMAFERETDGVLHYKRSALG